MDLAILTVLSVLTATADVRAVAAEGEVLWLGTPGGLVRLEGEEARVLTPRDGLPDGTVRALHLAGPSLWVGTDRGLARVDLATSRVVETHRTAAQVRAIETWRDATWVGTWRGLFRLPAGGSELVPVAELERVTAVRGAGGLLYVTTAGSGVHVHDGRRTRPLRSDRLAWDLAVSGDEAWVATSAGLDRYLRGRPAPRPEVGRSRELPVADLRAVRLVAGRPVVGAYGGGLHGWTGRGWEPLADQPVEARRVNAIETGPAGELLVGSPGGLSRLRAGRWSRPWTGAGLPDNDLSCLERTAEGLWVGTFRSGLALVRADGSVEVWTEARGLVDDRVNRLAVDPEGDLWVATDRGVMERRRGRFELRGLLGQHVAAVGVVSGRVYASAGADLHEWDGAAFVPVEGHPGRRVQDLALAPGGALASGTAEGLALRSAAGWRLRTSDHGRLPDDWVTAVAAHRGGLAVGTYNAGLALLRGEETTLLAPGLWVNAGALASVSGLLAAGTLDQGLWLHDGSASRTLTTADGLPDDDVTDVLDDGAGGLWIATRGGLARLGPAR